MNITAARRLEFALACLISLPLLCINILAQTGTPTPPPTPSPSQQTQPAPTPSTPAANPADVSSIDAILAAVYDVISGPAGKKRDWDRMRSLFITGARLIPTGPRPGNSYGSRVLTVEDYVTRGTTLFEKEGFFEKEIARRTESFGQIAHVFSTYEARHSPDDGKPFIRGINSIQLMNDGKRWWIVTIFWQAEDVQNPLPEKYLIKG
ncbi:MAG: hypothetical protein ND866_28515 [Pyrinomonadaceae bacterium]|nr:hypothetical protein [Pyrinomonadaceae bacterium]